MVEKVLIKRAQAVVQNRLKEEREAEDYLIVDYLAQLEEDIISEQNRRKEESERFAIYLEKSLQHEKRLEMKLKEEQSKDREDLLATIRFQNCLCISGSMSLSLR